jgi:hypothetical protein
MIESRTFEVPMPRDAAVTGFCLVHRNGTVVAIIEGSPNTVTTSNAEIEEFPTKTLAELRGNTLGLVIIID